MVGKTTKDLKMWVGCTQHRCNGYVHVVEEIQTAIAEGSVFNKDGAKKVKSVILERMDNTISDRDNQCSASADDHPPLDLS